MFTDSKMVSCIAGSQIKVNVVILKQQNANIMKNYFKGFISNLSLTIGTILFFSSFALAQQHSVVQVHADKSSGYGVAYGGPQNLPDRIVTALHVVAGKSTIAVVWQGKSSYAVIEKIYKAADLALLRLKTPLGIPQTGLYSGNPPWDTNVQFWEVPTNTRSLTAKTTVLEERTSLARISPRVANSAGGLTKALCVDAGQYYPGMNTDVINFKEPNIRKAHSGSPLTYNGKIIGLVDGGANLIGGKSCVWAIPAESFVALYNQGTAPSGPMQSCGGTAGNQYMFSGMRSDNPLLSPDEASSAAQYETSTNISSTNGTQLQLYHEYRMPFLELYETMLPDEQEALEDIFMHEEEVSPEDLLSSPIDLYVEANTGITVMVPSQSYLSVSSNEYGSFISTTSPGGLITMEVYISPNYDMHQGLNVLHSFKTYMAEHGYNMNTEDVEDYSDDPYTPYYGESIENIFYNDVGDITGEFYSDLMVNDGDFMAINVYIQDWAAIDNSPSERLFLYLLESCAMFSDFAYY